MDEQASDVPWHSDEARVLVEQPLVVHLHSKLTLSACLPQDSLRSFKHTHLWAVHGVPVC